LVYCAILLRHGEPGGRRAAKHLVLRRYHNEPDPAHLGFLKAVENGNSKRITGFVRTISWPPPPTFFSQGAIGVAHYIQKWFRFKLQEWIVSRMREIESKEGVYSLEGWTRRRTSIRDQDGAGQHRYAKEHLPSLVGEFQDSTGTCMAADVSMMQKPLDVSKMDIDWVCGTEDPLFRDLSKNQRYLSHLRQGHGHYRRGVQHRLQNLPEVESRLEAICELNHVLIRPEK